MPLMPQTWFRKLKKVIADQEAQPYEVSCLIFIIFSSWLNWDLGRWNKFHKFIYFINNRAIIWIQAGSLNVLPIILIVSLPY